MSIAFYPSFIILLILVLTKRYVFKYLCVVLAICIMSYHCYYIAKYQTSYYLNYIQDVNIANSLIDTMYNKYPAIYDGKYKTIVFIGSLPRTNIHPLMKAKDVFNGSFFSWDNGNPTRQLAFIKLMGFPLNIQQRGATDDMKDIINKMPSYPNKDCIEIYNDTIIVKLK